MDTSVWRKSHSFEVTVKTGVHGLQELPSQSIAPKFVGINNFIHLRMLDNLLCGFYNQ